MSASPAGRGEADIKPLLGAALAIGIGSGWMLFGAGLGVLLVLSAAWAFWAGGWVWSAAYGAADDALRAGLVALYPAALAGAFAAQSETLARLAAQPFVIAPAWLAVAGSTGGVLALLVVWTRARSGAERAEPERPSPAGPCAVVVATIVAVIALCHWIHVGADPVEGVLAGVALSFFAALLQALTRRLLRRRLTPRRLTQALVLPWLLLAGALLTWTIYVNHPRTIFREHLGDPPASVRGLTIETARRGLFDDHVEISFRIDPAELPRLAAQAGLHPEPAIRGEDATSEYVDHQPGATRRLTLEPSGRARFSWITRLGFP